MKQLLRSIWLNTSILLCIYASSLTIVLAEEIVIVVPRDSQINELSHQQVIHLFFGRLTGLPNTGDIEVVDVEPYRAKFYKQLVNKNIAEINAYWARLRFSGKTQPPRQLPSTEALKSLLQVSPAIISYMPLSQTDQNVKVVARIYE